MLVQGQTKEERDLPQLPCMVTEGHIYGREEVRAAVLQLLVNEKYSDASNKVPNVIPTLVWGV